MSPDDPDAETIRRRTFDPGSKYEHIRGRESSSRHKSRIHACHHGRITSGGSCAGEPDEALPDGHLHPQVHHPVNHAPPQTQPELVRLDRDQDLVAKRMVRLAVQVSYDDPVVLQMPRSARAGAAENRRPTPNNTPPSLRPHYRDITATTGRSALLARDRYSAAYGFRRLRLSLSRPASTSGSLFHAEEFSCSVVKPGPSSRHLHAGHRQTNTQAPV